jgi:hypothetical protein
MKFGAKIVEATKVPVEAVEKLSLSFPQLP